MPGGNSYLSFCHQRHPLCKSFMLVQQTKRAVIAIISIHGPLCFALGLSLSSVVPCSRRDDGACRYITKNIALGCCSVTSRKYDRRRLGAHDTTPIAHTRYWELSIIVTERVWFESIDLIATSWFRVKDSQKKSGKQLCARNTH
jgi:hypothetical protein